MKGCDESLLTGLRFEIRVLNLSSGLGEGATGVRGSDIAQNASADSYFYTTGHLVKWMNPCPTLKAESVG